MCDDLLFVVALEYFSFYFYFYFYIYFIFLATDSTVLCSADLSLESCESSDLKRTDVCQNPNVQLWLTLINEDHKDGPQHIRAPYSTNIQEFCSTGKFLQSRAWILNPQTSTSSVEMKKE